MRRIMETLRIQGNLFSDGGSVTGFGANLHQTKSAEARRPLHLFPFTAQERKESSCRFVGEFYPVLIYDNCDWVSLWRQRDAPVVTGHPEACAKTSLGDRRSQQVKGPTMVRRRQRERIAERHRTVPRNPAVTQPNGREATCLNLDRGSDLDLYRRFPQGARKSLPFPSPVLAPIYN